MAEAMSLKYLCEELKLDPRVTRMKLREAVKNNPILAATTNPAHNGAGLRALQKTKKSEKYWPDLNCALRTMGAQFGVGGREKQSLEATGSRVCTAD